MDSAEAEEGLERRHHEHEERYAFLLAKRLELC